MNKKIYLIILLLLLFYGCEDSKPLEENKSNDIESTKNVDKNNIINQESVTDEEITKDILSDYQVNWHFVHYYASHDGYSDMPFTDVYLLGHFQGTEEKVKIGTYIGFASEAHTSKVSHVKEEDFISGWQSYYSGGGVFVYLIEDHDKLLVMQHQIEEAIEDDYRPIADIELTTIDLPEETRVIAIQAVREKVVPLKLENELNINNWINSIAIREIRDIYNNIESEIRSEILIKSRKELTPVENHGLYVKTIYQDHEGKVRKYIEAAGSDDSALNIEYYYDLSNRMRFIFITGGAVNGTYIEHRVYFDNNGNKIWEIQKMEGEGYAFYEEWPEDKYILAPLHVFEND